MNDGSTLGDIVSGPDNALWFTDGGDNSIWKVTTSGQATAYTMPSSDDNPMFITVGPRRTVWFTAGGGKIGRLTESGTISIFALPYPNQQLNGIIRGPDGNLWFAQNQGSTIAVVNRINPHGRFLPYFTLPTSSAWPYALAIGSDGNVWVTERIAGQIARVTPSGVVTEFGQTHTQPTCITAGPDGNLWFTDGDYIGRITTAGVITEYVLLGGNASCITTGPDKHLWVTTGISPSDLIRVSTDGTQKFYPNPSGYYAGAITTGPDGNMWIASGPFASVYIRHVLTVSPSSLSFATIGQTQQLDASERQFAGTLTATSSNQSVATVAPGPTKNTFLVTAVGSGTATITIADTKQNTFAVPVTVP